MLDKFEKFVLNLNKYGIPIPFARDPKTQISSVSLTMMLISFVLVVFGLIGKYSKYLDINLTESLTLLGITSSLYFARKVSPNSSNNDKKDNE